MKHPTPLRMAEGNEAWLRVPGTDGEHDLGEYRCRVVVPSGQCTRSAAVPGDPDVRMVAMRYFADEIDGEPVVGYPVLPVCATHADQYDRHAAKL